MELLVRERVALHLGAMAERPSDQDAKDDRQEQLLLLEQKNEQIEAAFQRIAVLEAQVCPPLPFDQISSHCV